jgi:hypothetical protein
MATVVRKGKAQDIGADQINLVKALTPTADQLLDVM